MNIVQTAQIIKEKLQGKHPQTAIILGSGLGALGQELQNSITIPYKEIAGFPQTSVKGHTGQFICGNLSGQEVLCLQGRFHLYEGHPATLINEVILVLRELGIKELIVTNAAGSLHTDMPAGSIMLIKDHISINTPNPLIGPDDEKYGPRFPDMSNAYDEKIRAQIKSLAQKQGIALYEGTYFLSIGPCFETKAEIKMLQTLGADAVGMSTVPEVISAVHAGIKVLGLSVITNLGTGLQKEAPSHQETLENAAKASKDLTNLIKSYLGEKTHG